MIFVIEIWWGGEYSYLSLMGCLVLWQRWVYGLEQSGEEYLGYLECLMGHVMCQKLGFGESQEMKNSPGQWMPKKVAEVWKLSLLHPSKNPAK